MPVTLPQVNMNGTSRKALLAMHCESLTAVQSARDVLARNSVHRRDYQTLPDGTYSNAIKEHRDRLIRLNDIAVELETICLSLLDQ